MYVQVITATPRQLESLVRLSEALARMRLSKTVDEGHVIEALRLMTVRLPQRCLLCLKHSMLGRQYDALDTCPEQIWNLHICIAILCRYIRCWLEAGMHSVSQGDVQGMTARDACCRWRCSSLPQTRTQAQ